MNFLFRLLFVLLALPAALTSAEAGLGMRPNIILIMADAAKPSADYPIGEICQRAP